MRGLRWLLLATGRISNVTKISSTIRRAFLTHFFAGGILGLLFIAPALKLLPQISSHVGIISRNVFGSSYYWEQWTGESQHPSCLSQPWRRGYTWSAAGCVSLLNVFIVSCSCVCVCVSVSPQACAKYTLHPWICDGSLSELLPYLAVVNDQCWDLCGCTGMHYTNSTVYLITNEMFLPASFNTFHPVHHNVCTRMYSIMKCTVIVRLHHHLLYIRTVSIEWLWVPGFINVMLKKWV